MTRVLSVLVAAFLAYACSLAMARHTRPGDVGEYLERCEAFGWSGAALVVRGDRVLCNRGFGLASRASGIANTPDALFEIASLTKVITACAVMTLVEDGTIGLDDPIAMHLPGVPEDKGAITIRHLLSHTSGMPRSGPSGGGDDLETAVGAYLSGRFSTPPGKRSEYWNGGFALLAGVIEHATGESYESYCARRIFEPAAMTASGFTGQAFDEASLTTGYSGPTALRTAADHPYGTYGWQYKGMGGMVTSASDLRRFVEAYENGTLLAPETVRQMETPGVGPYALGWAVTQTDRGTRRIGHGGDVRGFRCYLLRFPEEETLIVVLSNTDDVPIWKIAWNLESLVFGQPMRTPPMPPIDRDADPGDLVGEYESPDGARLVVRLEGPTLRIAAVGASAMTAIEPSSRGVDAPAAVARARSFLDRVVASRPETIADRLAPGIPVSWARTLCTSIWPAHVRTHGELVRAESIGTRAIGPGSHEVLFALEHERASARLRIVTTRGRLQIFDLTAPRHLVERPFAWLADADLATFDWSADVVTARLRVRRGDAGVSLEVATDGVQPSVFTRPRAGQAARPSEVP